MEKILKLRQIFDIALVVMLIGTLVFSLVFGSILYLGRQEALREAEAKTEQAVNYIETYVDGELQRVEDVAYTLLSNKFASTHRTTDGKAFVTIDPTRFSLPTEEEIFCLLEQFLDANPQLSGVAIGFENFVYPVNSGPYGTACYVTNVSGKKERLYLGKMHDFHEKVWYREAAMQNRPYWSLPFRETSMHRVVSCYSVPLHGFGNRLVGVLALDIDTESFRQKCHEAAPFDDATVVIEQLEAFDDNANDREDKEALVRVQRVIPRNGWTITITCPMDVVVGGVKRMQYGMAIVGAVGLLLMIICFLILFRRMQKINMAKAGIESELRVASAIQMSMIPKFNPAYPGRDELDVYGFVLPAKSVGGDLYDYLIRDDKFYFCVGDVSGKGVPASLFMAVVRALFRNIATQTDDPAELVGRLNDVVAEGNEMNMFCTFFVGVLDLKTGHLAYCNAGHNAPIIRRCKEGSDVDIHYLKPHTNLALGVFGGFPFEAEELTFAPGEAIFLYTDGVTEAESPEHELFGEQATLDALHSVRVRHDLTPKAFVEGVYEKIKQHAGNAEQSDDITMLVVEYKGEK